MFATRLLLAHLCALLTSASAFLLYAPPLLAVRHAPALQPRLLGLRGGGGGGAHLPTLLLRRGGSVEEEEDSTVGFTLVNPPEVFPAGAREKH